MILDAMALEACPIIHKKLNQHHRCKEGKDDGRCRRGRWPFIPRDLLAMGVEITIKALKSGLHLGQMQVTKEAERVTRSVALSVVAYLLLVRLYGQNEALRKDWSLFKLKERFTEDVTQEHMRRSELRWQRKLKQLRDVA